MDWIRKLLADTAGIPDEARLAFLVGCLAVIGFTGWNMWNGHPFSPADFALGYGGIVGAFGGAVRLRGSN